MSVTVAVEDEAKASVSVAVSTEDQASISVVMAVSVFFPPPTLRSEGPRRLARILTGKVSRAAKWSTNADF